MSTWIHITNLPLYYDDYGLQDIFGDIGQIVATKVTKNEMILKSTGFVQFTSTKHAKLAASKKDQTVIANSAVRVYLIWSADEDLSTVRVENIPGDLTEADLEKYFDPYGQIVNITIYNRDNSSATTYALLSFCRVDYALNAVQEMNGTIIGMGGSLKVTLVNPDARNLKWKRNSFEYKRLQIPPVHQINEHNRNRSGHYHRHKHHHHENNHTKQQYQTNNNANIIIVNNINSVHSAAKHDDDDSKAAQNELLHPHYGSSNRGRSHFNIDKRGRGRHRTYRQSHHHNQEDRYHRHRHHGNRNHDNNNSDYSHHHHHQRRQHKRYHHEESHKKHTRKPRKYRPGRSVTSQSTLLGPLHNFSNGQYHTYSVTPSPTRSTVDSNDALSVDNIHCVGLQRMNSADSSSSGCSAQSLPNYGHMKRTALDRYGFPSKQVQNRHSPQPYQPQQVVPSTPNTPVSPASAVSTPSTTHSMPTPTGYLQQSIITRSKTPTPLIIPTPTLSKSSTTPISSTPPSATALKYPVNPVFTPQTNINPANINMITNGFNNMSMLSPSTLGLPLDALQNNANKSPQSVTSPIVLTPSTNLLLQQQLITTVNPNMLSPPQYLQKSSPSSAWQVPPPHPPKHFVFAQNKKANNSSPHNKKGKKSSSHSWSKEEQELGNKCYRIIEAKYPQRATKIVGMLLTANKIEDIKFMMQRPHILLAVASDYDQQQRLKELNKHK